MQKQVIAKGLLFLFLIICLLFMAFSGLSLYLGTEHFMLISQWHQYIGGLFILLLIIHLIHRRKKALKLMTQLNDVLFQQKYHSYCNLDRLLMTFAPVSVSELAEALQLPLRDVLNELQQGRICICDPQKSLAENLKGNDERLFAAITIVLKLRFDSYHNTN